jgi:ribosome-associated protein
VEDTIEPEAFSTALAKIALDRKAFDVAILDMSTLVDYTDIFLLCTARNRRHVASLAEEIRSFAKKDLGVQCLGTEGLPAARWVLVDFGSVVVHIFDEPLRAFYNLDGLWGDAPKLASPEPEGESDSDSDDTSEIEPPLP